MGHFEQVPVANEAKLAATSRLVREAVGVPPVARWRHRGDPVVLAESYLLPSRSKVVLPRFEIPIIGIQLDGYKVTFAKDTQRDDTEVFPYSTPNRCVLIPPDTVSYWTPGPGNVTLSGIYVVGRGEESIRRLIGSSRKPVMLRDTILVALARQMLGLAANRRQGVEEYGARLVDYLVAHLDWLSRTPPPKRPVRNTTYDAVMSMILSLIEDNIEQPLTIKRLAAKAGMSPALFRKRFADTTGMPVHSYVLKERIERACELIDECNLPLAAIAAQCGFSSQSHMTRVFRRELGVTPAERRRTEIHASSRD
ncbi:MAG: AraC family transcriptional regulator [Sinobacteraceae bacterium]|nr:AraC family transcriptional regulator [Nevskiaceae bacterium]